MAQVEPRNSTRLQFRVPFSVTPPQTYVLFLNIFFADSISESSTQHLKQTLAYLLLSMRIFVPLRLHNYLECPRNCILTLQPFTPLSSGTCDPNNSHGGQTQQMAFMDLFPD